MVSAGMVRRSLWLAAVCGVMLPIGSAAAAERAVLVELFEATWCTVCPHAERGVNQLAEVFPGEVIALQIHGNYDDYQTNWGEAREVFYFPQGYPTLWVDGVQRLVGAWTDDQQTYNAYVAMYLQARAVPTDVVVEIGADPIGSDAYELTVRVRRDAGTGDVQGMRIHLVNVMDWYPASEDGRYRNCLIDPEFDAIDVALAPGAWTYITVPWTPSAVQLATVADAGVAVWAQTIASGPPAQVLNAAALRWPFAPLPVGDVDCSGSVDFFDIDPFVLALTGSANYAAQYPGCAYANADCNRDGAVDFFDIDAFVTLLTQ